MVFMTDYRLMLVKSIAECSKHSAILLTFIQLPMAFKIFVFEWPIKKGLTVQLSSGVEAWILGEPYPMLCHSFVCVRKYCMNGQALLSLHCLHIESHEMTQM